MDTKNVRGQSNNRGFEIALKNTLSALLFDKLQSVEFYAEVIKNAVDFGEKKGGATFLDVGCGSGLAAKYAASKGYKALGLDTNPKSIQKAFKNQKDQNVRFECKELGGERAFIVFAASLLAVFEDREQGLKKLFDAVQEGGELVIVEPTKAMNTNNAAIYVKKRRPKEPFWLYLWAFARERNIVDEKIFSTLNYKDIRYIELMDGLIGVWKIKK